MNTVIKIAGLNILIDHINPLPQLKPETFHADDGKIGFSVSVNESDIEAERVKAADEAKLEGLPEPHYSDSETEFSAVHRKIADRLPEYDGVVFHGSAVEVDGKAYLFTAKSGTGKTTHTRLWLKNIDGTRVINGDKPVIRIVGGEVLVCGTPWMGKEQYGCADCVPLDSIALLSRAEENSISEITFKEAFMKLFEQTYRSTDRGVLLKTLGIISMIGKNVHFYDLRCNMDDEAATVSFGGMRR